MAQPEFRFKILMIGNSNAGKTSVVRRYADHTFSDAFTPTIGVDYRIKTLCVHDKICTLHIWDTAGQERFRTITASYYRGADGVIVVYDATDRKSFDNVQSWVSELDKNVGVEMVRLLIANKSDLSLSREVAFKEGLEMAQRYGMQFLETSAKTGSNISETFEVIAEQLVRKKLNDISAGDVAKDSRKDIITPGQRMSRLKQRISSFCSLV